MNSEKRELVLNPIGVIHTNFLQQPGTPIQSAFSEGADGYVEIKQEFIGGLKDLEEFERVWLIYWLDRSRSPSMTVTPFLDTVERGVFSTRAPSRPNPIGMSRVRLSKIVGNHIAFRDADMLDDTPLLDIKPYVPRFDSCEESRCGWYDRAAENRKTADERFVIPEEPS